MNGSACVNKNRPWELTASLPPVYLYQFISYYILMEFIPPFFHYSTLTALLFLSEFKISDFSVFTLILKFFDIHYRF